MTPVVMSAHPASEVEWWYLHGLLDCGYTVMASFWRYRGTRHLPEGTAATYALTAIDGSSRVQASWIDQAFLRQIRAIVGGLTQRTPDPYLEAFLEATEGNRLFAPYSLTDDSRLDVGTNPGLRVQVGPCAFSHDTDTHQMRLTLDGRGVDAAIAIDGAGHAFPMGNGGSFELAGKRMRGWTMPRLAGSGTLTLDKAERRIAGTFWLDHQWGEWHFANPRRHFHHPEWLYFAAVLEDGRSLAIFQYKQPRRTNRSKRFAYVQLHEPDGTCRQLRDVRIITHGSIESLRTNNLYEYGWTVELPEIGGRLEFEPFHPDQEVFVFTRQRGILELGCRLRGSLNGTDCAGWGFVEVFGDTLDINEYFWGQQKTNLAQQLESFLPRSSDPGWLQRVCQSAEPLKVDPGALDGAIFSPLWSMMDRGGKGWRSTWLTTCYFGYGHGNLSEQVRQLLPVIELLHTGSLVIDDIQDEAMLRRRRPTLHLEVGTDIAINAGCFCYFLPLLIIEELSAVSDSQRARMYAIIANALRQGHIGQAMDLMWSKGRYDIDARVRDFDATRGLLLEQFRLKTGCQLEAIARIAGVLADAPAVLVDTLAEYSRVFGVVFQIIDDIIGTQEGYEKLGKEEGEDIRNRKLNFVLLHALSAVNGAEREKWIRRVFESPPEDGVRAAQRLIDDTDSVNRCIDYGEDLMRKAWEPMSIMPPSDAKIVMRSVPQWLLRQRRARVRELRRDI